MMKTNAFNNYYEKQLRLLLDVLPEIDQHDCFALKGGTAINLFLRDFPRLSVDIDLTCLPLKPRSEFLVELAEHLETLALTLEKSGTAQRVNREYTKVEGQLSRLLVIKDHVTVKIEPNFVLRGSVYPPKKLLLSPSVQEHFFTSMAIQCLSFEDIYAGKLCAALDRQHPRDLFDVSILLENEGITTPIRQAFVVYAASSPRPIHELLDPNLLDIRSLFDNQFAGMTHNPVSYESLIAVREKFIDILQSELTENERKFLLSIKEGEPEWSLMPFAHLNLLPALQWKLKNVQAMPKEKKIEMTDKLKKVLGL